MFIGEPPTPTPRKAHIAISHAPTQKNSHENALEAPPNHSQGQTYLKRNKQPLQPNYADLIPIGLNRISWKRSNSAIEGTANKNPY